MHTGKISQRSGPRSSGLVPTHTPAPITGSSSGIGAPIPAATIGIFADPLDIDVRERRLIRLECERIGLPIVSIACVAVGLIDFNPSVQRFHLERCRKYLDLAYEYEAKNLLLVLGEYIWERQVITPAEQWQTGVRNVRELGKYAADLGLEIALELEPFKLSLINNVETMLRFLDDVAQPAVKANIDVSHLALS